MKCSQLPQVKCATCNVPPRLPRLEGVRCDLHPAHGLAEKIAKCSCFFWSVVIYTEGSPQATNIAGLLYKSKVAVCRQDYQLAHTRKRAVGLT